MTATTVDSTTIIEQVDALLQRIDSIKNSLTNAYVESGARIQRHEQEREINEQ